jgi:hypothetical protein
MLAQDHMEAVTLALLCVAITVMLVSFVLFAARRRSAALSPDALPTLLSLLSAQASQNPIAHATSGPNTPSLSLASSDADIEASGPSMTVKSSSCGRNSQEDLLSEVRIGALSPATIAQGLASREHYVHVYERLPPRQQRRSGDTVCAAFPIRVYRGCWDGLFS